MSFIPVNTPVITDADREAVSECLGSGWVSSEGPQVPEFEAAFAQRFNRRFAIAVSSGTAALDVAIRAIGLREGDEVLVPSMTIISCASSIIASGATPVPVDCDGTDWNAHLHHFQEQLGPKTRAVMLVHLYGLCADLDPIIAWAGEKGLRVIEDNSQGMGLSYHGRPCGEFGDCSVFSLYANKLITTGEGGMVLTDSVELAERCRSLRNLCFDNRKRFWHEELGWNYRMTAMQAALGNSQLARFGTLVQRKRDRGLRYYRALSKVPFLKTAPDRTSYCDNIFWVFGLVVDGHAPFDREDLTGFLAQRKIGTRTFFYGLHEQPAVLRETRAQPARLPVTERLSMSGFYLPSGLGLDQEDQDRVIEAVLEFTDAHGG